MEYVAKILDGVSSGTNNKKSRPSFFITDEQRKAIAFSEEPIGINGFAKTINEIISTNGCKGVSGAAMAAWLADQGYLSQERSPKGKSVKKLNSRSKELDIVEVESEFQGHRYMQLRYGIKAQKFLLEHIEEIVK